MQSSSARIVSVGARARQPFYSDRAALIRRDLLFFVPPMFFRTYTSRPFHRNRAFRATAIFFGQLHIMAFRTLRATLSRYVLAAESTSAAVAAIWMMALSSLRVNLVQAVKAVTSGRLLRLGGDAEALETVRGILEEGCQNMWCQLVAAALAAVTAARLPILVPQTLAFSRVIWV